MTCYHSDLLHTQSEKLSVSTQQSFNRGPFLQSPHCQYSLTLKPQFDPVLKSKPHHLLLMQNFSVTLQTKYSHFGITTQR